MRTVNLNNIIALFPLSPMGNRSGRDIARVRI
jgi:hypothetical protein